MKLIVTFLFSLLLHTTLWGQNSLLLAFGQNYEQVQAQLNTYTGMRFEQTEPARRLLVHYRGTQAVYLFHNDRLYQVSLIKEYQQFKTARQAYQGCLNYFEAIHAQVLDQREEKKDFAYVAVKAGHLYEVELRTYSRKQQQLMFSSRSLEEAPASDITFLRDFISSNQ